MAREQVEEEVVLELRLPNREPTGQLGPQDWLKTPGTAAVVAALKADGGDMRFVGGCVRNALAKRPVTDIDIATPLPPDTVMARLEAAGLKAVPTGIAHGTVTAIAGEQSFEITTLRKDVETDGRHALVEYTDDWIEDAKRRDFTINAMSCTPDGDVYDPFDGIPDLAHGRIRFVGLAKDRVSEDYLRILRYFRFFGLFGRPPADKSAMSACRMFAPKLAELSAERIRDELFKILMVPDPADVMLRMRGLGVLDQILPEAGDVGRLRAISWLANRGLPANFLKPDGLRRLAALIDPETGTDGALALSQRLKFSNRETDTLARLATPPEELTPDLGGKARRALMQMEGAERVRDWALINWAGDLALAPHLPSERTRGWLKLMEETSAWEPRAFPLKGQDALDLGVPPGPKVGALLDEVEAWWRAEDFAPDRGACLEHLKRSVEASKAG